MNFGVIVFPGSNCDDDMVHVLGDVMGANVKKIWHKDTSLKPYGHLDCIAIPGGFSFGDYLRSGAIARFAPIMNDVVDFANGGGHVIGICNGFQIMCEAELLPGVLLRNINQRFICRNVHLKVENSKSALTCKIGENKTIKIPIAHADGRYFANEDDIKSIEDNEQVLFRYCDESGLVSDISNVNGSINNIAGICNKEGNVLGMMPHPERASETELGNEDGRLMFDSLLYTLEGAYLSV